MRYRGDHYANADSAVKLAEQGEYDQAEDYFDNLHGDEDEPEYQTGARKYFDACLRSFDMDGLPEKALEQVRQSCVKQATRHPPSQAEIYYTTVREYSNFYNNLTSKGE